MRGRQDFEEFVVARTTDIHHDAYLLTASQEHAERLVVHVLAELDRDQPELTQAASTARLRMARIAARADTPAGDPDVAARFRPLAALTSRQRAILLLELLDGHDLHSAARVLHLSSRQVGEAYAAIPPELTDAESAQLRRLLEDFGDLVESPDPATTLGAIHALPPPPRRPWWSYAAAVLVVALTVSCVWIAQTWQNDWLRTAAGLNHSHGTHFPAYTQGYKLVAIHDIAPGPVETIPAGSNDAVAVECATNAAITISSGLMGDFRGSCSDPAGPPALTQVVGTTSVSINDFSRDTWPVAVYQSIPWDEYPVATSGFIVEHDQTLRALRHVSADGYHFVKPLVAGAVLTLHGDRERPDGTFTGQLEVPAAHPGSVLVISGLLSPTTTGRYSLLVENTSQWSNCGPAGIVHYAPGPDALTCSIFDRQVPQLNFSTWGVPTPRSRVVPVRITVRNALGPWTLQLAFDSYRIGADGQPVSP